jgi:hypothetical protein
MNSRPELTDEALSDLLATPADKAIDADHADSETLALKAALRSYRTETLAWAERRSATEPSLASKAKESRWAAVPQWSLACVAVLAVTAGVVHFAGYGAEDVAPAANMSVMTTPAKTIAADDIDADNQLLGSIDQALRYTSMAPAAVLQDKPAKQAGSTTHSEVTD